MIDHNRYLKTALAAVSQGGKLFQKFFGRPGKVEIKNADPRNLVTAIDRKIEKLIRSRLTKDFPKHKIIGEELANDQISPGDLVWYIDPIDGTANFIHGFPFCCISLALWDNHGPVAAVVYNPVLGKTYRAARGQGAYCNKKRLRVSKQQNLVQTFGGYGWGRNIANAGRHFPVLVKDFNKIRTLGSTAMEIALVAESVYDFHLQAEVNIWDFAASILLLQEAGGRATDWEGGPITPQTKRIIASNGKTHQALLRIVKKLA
ncbi:MAG: inositol monophosphatase [Patescibacteria group bacterium]|nr:inositol monophosphatase [Patescibacteria group bacterium]